VAFIVLLIYLIYGDERALQIFPFFSSDENEQVNLAMDKLVS